MCVCTQWDFLFHSTDRWPLAQWATTSPLTACTSYFIQLIGGYWPGRLLLVILLHALMSEDTREGIKSYL